MIDREEQNASELPFQLESKILRQIANPQIPGFVDAFTINDVHYIVQEFIDGLPLSCLIDTGRRFSEAEVKRIVSQLLAVLSDLHCPRRKKDAVVHRDLRLSNLLLKDDKLFLIDFGFARFLDLSQNNLCPDPLEKKFGCSTVSGRGLLHKQLHELQYRKKIPGAETYRLLRKEISPRSDLFGAGVVAVDLFINWVEDDSLFNRTWQEVLPLSALFVDFLQNLLSRKNGFKTAAEAIDYLRSIF